jgi:hypothetical protein
MNSIDFLKELNEVDDDLLMKVELPPTRKPRIRRIGVNAVVVALVLCLMSVTVAAVTISIRIFTSEDMVPNYENYHIGFFNVNSKITTIEYELSPQKIAIPLQWENALTDAWKGFGYSYDHFTGIDMKDSEGNRINYGGIEQLEQLLDIKFVSSENLELVTQGAYVTLAVTDQDRAAEQFRSEGIVSPDGIIIYLPFLRNAQTGLNPEIVDYCGLSIFIPLTDAFADRYASHCVLSSAYKQDLTQNRFFSCDDIEIVLLENTVQGEDPLSGYAAWEHEGIGYLIEMKTNRDVETLPSNLLTPYLENLEG